MTNVHPFVRGMRTEIPRSIDAEHAVLAGLMVDNAAWDEVSEILTSSDFYVRAHKTIFDHISRMLGADKTCDMLTLSESLEDTGRLDEVGGRNYLFELVDRIPSAANIVAYAQIIRDKSRARQLLDEGNAICSMILQQGHRDIGDMIDEAEQRITAIGERESGNLSQVIVTGNEACKRVFRHLDELYQNPGKLAGHATPWQEFNRMTNGLKANELIILAARPAMGKTSFAINIADQLLDEGKSVLFFSMEMGSEQLTMRSLASKGRVPLGKMISGELEDQHWLGISRAMQQMRDYNIHIDERGSLTPSQIRSTARKVKRDAGLDLIIIDYLQIMRGEVRAENRNLEVAQISGSLKALAKELKVPVVVLSQLNRDVEKRANKRPMMADLRDSGSLEQDADLIVFLYRDCVYNPDTEVGDGAEVIIGKQRQGETGTIKVRFEGQYCQFTDYDDGFYRRPNE